MTATNYIVEKDVWEGTIIENYTTKKDAVRAYKKATKDGRLGVRLIKVEHVTIMEVSY